MALTSAPGRSEALDISLVDLLKRSLGLMPLETIPVVVEPVRLTPAPSFAFEGDLVAAVRERLDRLWEEPGPLTLD